MDCTVFFAERASTAITELRAQLHPIDNWLTWHHHISDTRSAVKRRTTNMQGAFQSGIELNLAEINSRFHHQVAS